MNLIFLYARTILWYSDWVAAILGFIFNILLIIIVKKIRQKEFAVYKKVLLTCALFDTLLSISIGPVGLSFEPAGSYVIAYTHGIIYHLPKSQSIFILIVNLSLYYAGLANYILVFVYRYNIIVKDHVLSKLAYLVGLLSNIVINIIIGSTIWYISFTSLTEEELVIADKNLEDFRFNTFDGKSMNIFVFNMFEIKGMVSLIYCAICCSVTWIVIIWCYIKIKCQLELKKNVFSEKTKQLQSQLNLTMLIQSGAPLFLLLIPVLALIICMFAGISFHGAGIMIYFQFKYIPLINALVNIILIRQCKKEFKKMMKRFCCLKETNVVNDSSDLKSKVNGTGRL